MSAAQSKDLAFHLGAGECVLALQPASGPRGPLFFTSIGEAFA